jgi:hypothetical protein
MKDRMPAAAKKEECPVAPPARRTTYAKALHRACVVVGGSDKLAARLGVPEMALRDWMEGRDEPSEEAFLATVELLLLYLEHPGQAN